MTTTNDGGIHPMVMKAARAQNAIAARMTGMNPQQAWLIYREFHVKDATEMLTECGALECLAVVENVDAAVNVDESGKWTLSRKFDYAKIDDAKLKVYGSAPE